MNQIDKALFENGLAVPLPGRLARHAAWNLLVPCQDLSLGTSTTFAFEAIHDLVAILIANIEEQDREITRLQNLLANPKD